MRMPSPIRRVGAIAVPIALCGLLAQPALGGNATNARAADATASRQACDFTAYVMETDPAGLNVRSRPGIEGTILGTIPPVHVDASDGMTLEAHPEVQVLASANGWFLITDASDNATLMDLDDQAKRRPMYSGRGWVSGSKLAVKSQAERARLAPAATAGTAFTSQGGTLDFDGLSHAAATLVACKGQWVLAEFDVRTLDAADFDRMGLNPEARTGAPPGRIRGWLDQLCGLQETACSGIAEDSK
ncbi:MAG: SH3 domain-containing protein [Thermomonas sp.]